MRNTKAIVKVEFKTVLPEEELQAVTSGDMPVITEVPGLISKLYHVNPATGMFGAVYHFESEGSADNYLHSPLIKTMENRYRTVPGSLQLEKVKVAQVLTGANTAGNTLKLVSRHWKTVTAEQNLKDMLDASVQKTVLLFKNSNKCPVGRSMLKQLDGLLQKNVRKTVRLYLLDVIAERDMSNQIAAIFSIKHASPQVLLIKNGCCVYHASQMEIDCAEIIKKICARG